MSEEAVHNTDLQGPERDCDPWIDYSCNNKSLTGAVGVSLNWLNWDLAFLFKKDTIYISMVNTNISAYI